MEPNTTITKKYTRRSDDEWIKIITDCRTSGLSDIAWCREHNIRTSTFYANVRRLTEKACQLPVNPRSSGREYHEIVPLRIQDEPLEQIIRQEDVISQSSLASTDVSDVAVRMSFRDISLEFTNHAQKSTILNVIAALSLLC